MALTSYKNLIVWQKSFDLCIKIYEITKHFPREELFNLTSQMRRASLSVPSNIAEGYNRNSTKEYIRFLNIAYGSLSELETQFLIAEKLAYISEAKMLDSIEQIKKMIYSILKKLK